MRSGSARWRQREDFALRPSGVALHRGTQGPPQRTGQSGAPAPRDRLPTVGGYQAGGQGCAPGPFGRRWRSQCYALWPTDLCAQQTHHGRRAVKKWPRSPGRQAKAKPVAGGRLICPSATAPGGVQAKQAAPPQDKMARRPQAAKAARTTLKWLARARWHLRSPSRTWIVVSAAARARPRCPAAEQRGGPASVMYRRQRTGRRRMRAARPSRQWTGARRRHGGKSGNA